MAATVAAEPADGDTPGAGLAGRVSADGAIAEAFAVAAATTACVMSLEPRGATGAGGAALGRVDDTTGPGAAFAGLVAGAGPANGEPGSCGTKPGGGPDGVAFDAEADGVTTTGGGLVAV